jgi:hypothetical protein
MTFRLFPPSSIVTFLSVAAALRDELSVSVPPVNEIFAILFQSASPRPRRSP